jgi:CubicO group peptidase (beta-lactamase class C family)
MRLEQRRTLITDDRRRDYGGTMTTAVASQVVEGHVSRGFEAVRRAFEENFVRRGELGGACCAYYRGEKVVDLWGGTRNKVTGEPWERDTMVVVHSATKGLAAMTLALAHSRGWLDYDERVATYWPEFAQQGKETITVRQLLAHQAGLFAFDEPVDRGVVADLDRLATVMARHKPAWEPGTRLAYHALTLGFYEGELMRRIDPRHRTLGQFFQDEIAAPLGEDVYIRLPEEIPNSRLAVLAAPGRVALLLGFPFRLTLEAMNPRSNIHRALVVNPGTSIYLDEQRIYARNFEVPSGNAVGTARGIAHAYGIFASGGRELDLRRETLDLLAAPAIPPSRGFYDECMKADGVEFSLGFMKSCPAFRFGGPSSYGSPGAGGAMGFADPKAGIGYAYVTSRMGTALTGDPRDMALSTALYAALRLQ